MSLMKIITIIICTIYLPLSFEYMFHYLWKDKSYEFWNNILKYFISEEYANGKGNPILTKRKCFKCYDGNI
jgi:hypothetical protein